MALYDEMDNVLFNDCIRPFKINHPSKDEIQVLDTEFVRMRCLDTHDDKHKFIIFYIDEHFYWKNSIITNVAELAESLYEPLQFIETTLLHAMSFTLLDYGYRIFLAYNEKCIEIKPGMNIPKLISKQHHLSRLVLGGAFNNLLNIPDYIFPLFPLENI